MSETIANKDIPTKDVIKSGDSSKEKDDRKMLPDLPTPVDNKEGNEGVLTKKASDTMADAVEFAASDEIFRVESADVQRAVNDMFSTVEFADNTGFKKLTTELAEKGSKDPKALASWIGRRKYGKAGFDKRIAKGKSGPKAQTAEDEGVDMTSWLKKNPKAIKPILSKMKVGNERPKIPSSNPMKGKGQGKMRGAGKGPIGIPKPMKGSRAMGNMKPESLKPKKPTL